MNWKRWKRGLIIATLTGFATGAVALVIGVTWQQAGILLVGSVAKDVLLYLRQFPVQSLVDTEPPFHSDDQTRRWTRADGSISHVEAPTRIDPPNKSKDNPGGS